MKVPSDAELDILRILLGERQIEESDEDKPGVIIGCDAEGMLLG